jgi:hypothetical protein
MCYQALIHYFQIGEVRNKRLPMSEMLEQTGISFDYLLYRYKDIALDFLGIRDET